MLKTVVLLNILVEAIHFVFHNSRNVKIYIFCNITNVLTVTLKQFNEPPLNKSINYLKKTY